jgi:hypothetical protein
MCARTPQRSSTLFAELRLTRVLMLAVRTFHWMTKRKQRAGGTKLASIMLGNKTKASVRSRTLLNSIVRLSHWGGAGRNGPSRRGSAPAPVDRIPRVPGGGRSDHPSSPNREPVLSCRTGSKACTRLGSAADEAWQSPRPSRRRFFHLAAGAIVLTAASPHARAQSCPIWADHRCGLRPRAPDGHENTHTRSAHEAIAGPAPPDRERHRRIGQHRHDPGGARNARLLHAQWR